MREVLRADAATAVTDADRHARRLRHRARHDPATVGADGTGIARRRGVGFRDGDFDRGALVAALDGGAEGVLQQLGQDVLDVGGDVGEGGVGGAGDGQGRPHAVFELAELGDEGLAVANDGRGPEAGVDDADVGGGRGRGLGGMAARGRGRRRGRRGRRCRARLRGEVQGDVLFGDEAGADAGTEVVVEEAGDGVGGDVSAALEEAAGEGGDGVGVGLDEVGHGVGEVGFVVEGADVALVVGEEGGEGVQVVGVDAGDVRVGDDDEGEVAEGLDAVREADGDEGEGEVRRGEEGALRERGAAMAKVRRGVLVEEKWGGVGGRGEGMVYRTRSERARLWRGLCARRATWSSAMSGAVGGRDHARVVPAVVDGKDAKLRALR